jgi:LasA protease
MCQAKSHLGLLFVLLSLSLACAGLSAPLATPVRLASASPTISPPTKSSPKPTSAPTAVPTVAPSQTLPAGVYRAQSGDTLPGLVGRFNVLTDTLLARNPTLPLTQTIAPGTLLDLRDLPGQAGGYADLLLPDSEVVYSPGAEQFDIQSFVLAQPGYLATYTETLDTDPPGSPPRAGWQIVEQYARSYSIHPHLLLALLDYQARALSDPAPAEFTRNYPLGAYSSQMLPGLSHQLGWVGNQLNYGYYGWRLGAAPTPFTIGPVLFQVSPTLNAGTFAVLWVLGQLYAKPDFAPEKFSAAYRRLFGDPFARAIDLLPGALTQPPFQLPFEPGKVWSFTSGPHPGYGRTLPFGALDFAPPIDRSGCVTSTEWVTAVGPGDIVFSDAGRVELDLGNGWTVVYLHIATFERIPAGASVNAGDRLGHPSCEGGAATGTHVHLSRRYRGEWIPADGFAPFEMSGWVAHGGSRPYLGYLMRGGRIISACPCADGTTLIQLDP